MSDNNLPDLYIPPAMTKSRSGLIKLGELTFDKTDPVAQYLVSLKSVESQKTMYRCLRQFAVWFYHDLRALPEQIHWSDVSYQDILDYQLSLDFKPDPRDPQNPAKFRKLTPSTKNTYIIAIRGVMKKACKLRSIATSKKVSLETYSEIEEISLETAQSLAKSRALREHEIDAFLSSFNDHGKDEIRHKKNTRDKALFYTMAGCGLRVNELVTMQFPRNILFDESAIQIIGKGSKERKVPMNDEVVNALLEYIEVVRGENAGALWHPINRHGQVLFDKQLTSNGVRDMMRNRGMSLDVHVTPHYLRKTFGTRLLEEKEDLFTVQDLLGHSNVNTTRTYDTREHSIKRSAVDKITFKKK